MFVLILVVVFLVKCVFVLIFLVIVLPDGNLVYVDNCQAAKPIINSSKTLVKL